MPFRQFYGTGYGSKGSGRRGLKRIARGTGSALVVATKALRIARKVGSVVNSELKLHDTSLALQPSSTGAVASLSNISQGLEFSDRMGRSIRLKSVQLGGQIGMSSSAVRTTARVIIFIDKAYTGTPPTPVELMQSDDVTSLRNGNPHFLKRFRVLNDRMYHMQDNGQQLRVVKWYRRMNHHILYDDIDTADENSGALWIYFVSNESMNVPTYTADFRMRYYDN